MTLAEVVRDLHTKLDRVRQLSDEYKRLAETVSPIEGRRRKEFASRLDEILEE